MKLSKQQEKEPRMCEMSAIFKRLFLKEFPYPSSQWHLCTYQQYKKTITVFLVAVGL